MTLPISWCPTAENPHKPLLSKGTFRLIVLKTPYPSRVLAFEQIYYIDFSIFKSFGACFISYHFRRCDRHLCRPDNSLILVAGAPPCSGSRGIP
jgi:hypothetical protein